MPDAIPFSPIPLTPCQRWLCCLAVAIKRRDPVLITQLAEQAEHQLTPARLRRTVSRLDRFQLTAEDWHWLRSLQQELAAAE